MVSYINSKGITYYLHEKNITLRGNRPHHIFYFARELKDNAVAEKPSGYEIVEGRTGLVFLRKVKVPEFA